MTEVVQQIIPGRNKEMYNEIDDTLGIIAGYSFIETNKIGLARY